MADNNKLSLVVEIDVNKANASIKTVNVSLSSIEQAAAKAARGASSGIDGMTASMMKGAAAGNLIADAFRKALEWAKAWTLGAVEHAAHIEKLTLSMNALAKAHNITAEAANASVESVKKIGYETQDAVHAVNRLMIADMDLSKAEGLAKLAKDAAAIENITPGEGLENSSWRWSRARRAGSGPWASSSISTRWWSGRRNLPAGRSPKMRFFNSGTTR